MTKLMTTREQAIFMRTHRKNVHQYHALTASKKRKLHAAVDKLIADGCVYMMERVTMDTAIETGFDEAIIRIAFIFRSAY